MNENQYRALIAIVRNQGDSVDKLIKNKFERNQLFVNLSEREYATLENFLREQLVLNANIIPFFKVISQFVFQLCKYTKLTLSLDLAITQNLLFSLHHIFQHGLKFKQTWLGYRKTYVNMVSEFFASAGSENIRIINSKAIEDTNILGSNQGLAWFSFLLNNGILGKTLEAFMHPSFLREWYEPYAFLNSEGASFIPGLLVGIDQFNFEIDISGSAFKTLAAQALGKIPELDFNAWLDDVKSDLNSAIESVITVHERRSEPTSPTFILKQESLTDPLEDSTTNASKLSIDSRKSYKDSQFESQQIEVTESSDEDQVNFAAVQAALNFALSAQNSYSSNLIQPVSNEKSHQQKKDATQSNISPINFELKKKSLSSIIVDIIDKDANSTLNLAETSLESFGASGESNLNVISGAEVNQEAPLDESVQAISLEKSVSQLKSELVALKRSNLAYLSERDVTLNKNKELKLRNNHLEKQLLMLEAQIKDQTTRKEEFESNLADLSHQVGFMTQQLEAKRNQMLELQSKYNESHKQCLQLSDQLHDSHYQIENLKMQLQNAQRQSELASQRHRTTLEQLEGKDDLLQVLAMEMAKSKLDLNELALGVKIDQSKRQQIHPWVDDALVTQCTGCDKPFSLVLRKHHCRRDGKVYCDGCTPHRFVLPASKKPVRVCKTCYLELTMAPLPPPTPI